MRRDRESRDFRRARGRAAARLDDRPHPLGRRDPLGRRHRDAFECIVDEIVAGLAWAGPLDGVFRDLHGAMVAEHIDDGEAEVASIAAPLCVPHDPQAMANTFAPLIVQGTDICASAILIAAIPSFLGAGVSTKILTWGNIMAKGRSYFQIKPGLIF